MMSVPNQCLRYLCNMVVQGHIRAELCIATSRSYQSETTHPARRGSHSYFNRAIKTRSALFQEYIISCNLGLVRVHKVFHTNCDSNPKERSNCWDQFSQGGDRSVVSMPYLAALDGARSRHDLCPRLILRDFYSEHTFTCPAIYTQCPQIRPQRMTSHFP